MPTLILIVKVEYLTYVLSIATIVTNVNNVVAVDAESTLVSCHGNKASAKKLVKLARMLSDSKDFPGMISTWIVQ